jgi:REP element-mobilizing transposase RayT
MGTGTGHQIQKQHTMRKYDPRIHHRRSVRLRGYDYSKAGAYFVTICTNGRRCLFGEIWEREMYLNGFGQIAYDVWEQLPERWKHVELGAFQIMPNHMHGILVFQPVDEAVDLSNPKLQWANKPTLGQAIGAYCSIVSTQCLQYFKQNKAGEFLEKIWQRGFHEHIIRDMAAFDRISNYIINNPANWKNDKFFPNP